MLDFSFSDDILLLRDDEKLDEYRIKREVATDALNGLKQYYRTDGVQHARIDRVSSLLLEKEKLLLGVMNTLSGFSRTDSLLQRRIPVIISQTAQQPDVTETTKKINGVVCSDCSKRQRKNLLTHVKGRNGNNRRLPNGPPENFIPRKKRYTHNIQTLGINCPPTRTACNNVTGN
ncbi:MAG: hypothetical protein LUD46_04700 [Parabacteroides sp.]|nr:hypothetical protein [Parabacteroides sp.]